jgi:hypothetical protein
MRLEAIGPLDGEREEQFPVFFVVFHCFAVRPQTTFQDSKAHMARKQDSPEVATEKALAVAEYESQQRRTLNRLAKLREERLQRESSDHLKQKKRAG